MAKRYIVTFGKHSQPTQHQYDTKTQAVSKARELKQNLPNIRFGVKKLKRV